MGNLSAFLKPSISDEVKEIKISDRFKNEDGSVEMFKIRALSQAENESITRRCKSVKNSKTGIDNEEYARRLIVEATVYPDFRLKEICNHYGTEDPLLVPGKMLLAGEYGRLVQAITELSGFNKVEDEIKN